MLRRTDRRAAGAALFLCAWMTACGDEPAGPAEEPTTLAVTLQQDEPNLDAWGDSIRLVAAVTDEEGAAVPGATLAWESLSPEVATVSAGLVRTLAPGSAVIRITASRIGAEPATAEITVHVSTQRNAACTVTPAADRGPAAGVPGYGSVSFPSGIPDSEWTGRRAFALDYDGDGDDDVIRLEYSFPFDDVYSGNVRVFRNDAGTLVEAPAELSEVIPDHPRDFEIADFTGDGRPDLYVAQHGYDADPYPGAPNLFITWTGTALAELAGARIEPAGTGSFSHGSATADVDCDGDLDLLELNISPAAPNRLYLNDGTGQLTAAPAVALPITGVPGGQRWQEVAALDYENDGDMDFFLGARSGPGWNEDAVLINDGFGGFRFALPQRLDLPAPRYSPAHAINNAKSADFNGDGLDDLILFEIPQPFSTSSVLRLWLNQGDGSFVDSSAEWGIPATCSEELVEPLRVRDMNHDGWPDVLLPPQCPEAGGAGILFNTGTGFDAFSFSTIEPWLNDVVTPIDYDGDDRLDLLFAERGEAVLVLHP